MILQSPTLNMKLTAVIMLKMMWRFPQETDSDEAADFVDETLITHNLENIESGLIKIWDGFLMAASGYEDIGKELPNLDPAEVPQLMEQMPIPQLTEHSKPFQQPITVKLVRRPLFKNSCTTIY